MTTELPDVDVLIVSLCAASRAAAIRRAIDTALSQEGVRARVTIVVNGQRYDRELFETLKRTRGVRVLYQTEPSIFLARRCAREEVRAPFFGFLDDDDQLLPGALATRVHALVHDPDAAAAITDGFLTAGGSQSLILGAIAAIREDPLHSLLEGNWLATASALFRTAAVPPEYFDVTIRSNDMTFLAFRLALGKRMIFVDVPTYRKTYSPDSISLTQSWALPSLDTLDRMLEFPMPASVRRGLRRKCAAAAHQISDIHRERGEAASAWRYHLRSLMEPGGLLRYALHTRHLFAIRRGMRP